MKRYEDFIRKIIPSYRSKRELEESLLTLYKRFLRKPITNERKIDIEDIYSRVGVSGENIVIEESLPIMKDFVKKTLMEKIEKNIKIEHLINDNAEHIVTASLKIVKEREDRENND